MIETDKVPEVPTVRVVQERTSTTVAPAVYPVLVTDKVALPLDPKFVITVTISPLRIARLLVSE